MLDWHNAQGHISLEELKTTLRERLNIVRQSRQTAIRAVRTQSGRL